MAVDRKARTQLRKALVSYMADEIRSFEFDDQNTEFQSAKTTTDNSVHQISLFLFNIHDDFIDQSISVSPDGWAVLRRILAFLSTDLDIEAPQKEPAWPFQNDEEWQRHESLLNDIDLSEYDPVIHCRQIQPWWNRIPSSLGFAILGSLLVAVLILLFGA